MRIVTDANVLISAVLSNKSSSASKFVFELIQTGRVQSYTCDALVGEIYRVMETDPKLKRVNPVYFSEFMAKIRVWLNHVQMKDLEHNQSVLNLVGNDWYVIAVAKSISANYIITFDKYLLSRKKILKEEDDILVVTPEEFEKDYKQVDLRKLGEDFLDNLRPGN